MRKPSTISTVPLEMDSRLANSYFGRGNSFATLGDLPRAIADFTQAIEMRQDFAEAYRARGFAHLEAGEEDKGQADLAKFEELNGRRS